MLLGLLQAALAWDRVQPIGDMLAGSVPRGPLAPVFKTVGQAAWDLAAARVVCAI